MKYHKNTLRLRSLMSEHGVSTGEVADLLGRKPHTVYQWRGTAARAIPDALLELLELKLSLRAGQPS